MRRRSESPYWLTARYDGECSHCHRKVKKGERIFYFPNGRSVFCDAEDCGERESRAFEAAKFDEQNGCL